MTSQSNCGPKLLTIAIPTYNRAKYLELCLAQISKQISGNEQYIELIVSDNNSSDETENIINNFLSTGLTIRYIKNKTNLGPDKNIYQCYQMASGKYVLIVSDDDVLLDFSIDKIISILRDGDYGVVYLNSYGFINNHISEMPVINKSGYCVYKDKKLLISRVNFWFTFISGNIVNKSRVTNDLAFADLLGTNLIQLVWTFSALFNSDKNVVVEEQLVAVKGGNTGGYKLCQVFAVNINKIFESFVNIGINNKYFTVINKHLLRSFFPPFMLSFKKNDTEFNQEDCFRTLYSVYRFYPTFWLFTVPIIYLPAIFAKAWFVLILSINKAISCYDNVSRYVNHRSITRHAIR